MDRIIQGYKMGGKVKYYNEGTPKTVTGLPAGGNAASAISSYLTALSLGLYRMTQMQFNKVLCILKQLKKDRR